MHAQQTDQEHAVSFGFRVVLGTILLLSVSPKHFTNCNSHFTTGCTNNQNPCAAD